MPLDYKRSIIVLGYLIGLESLRVSMAITVDNDFTPGV